MSNLNKPLHTIQTINQAVRILAYNSSSDLFQQVVLPIDDKKKLTSLAESPYDWTEKQGKLAVFILKKYKKMFETANLSIDNLLNNPVFEQPFRVINFQKSIDITVNDEGQELIELKFPYNEKLVKLIRCLKQKTQNLTTCTFDGESKVWYANMIEISLYYLMLIAIRYNFTIVNNILLENFEEIRAEKKKHNYPKIEIEEDKINFKNVSENLKEYWKKFEEENTYLQQRDHLKQLGLSKYVVDRTEKANTLSKKIAYCLNSELFIDSTRYNKIDFLKTLQELNDLPAFCLMSGELDSTDDIIELNEWINIFKEVGIEENQLAFGFDLMDLIRKEFETKFLEGESKTAWETISKLIKHNKKIDDNTKIIFVRNRIPRALQKASLKIKCAFTIQKYNAFWPTQSTTLATMVENLPKRLYYMRNIPNKNITHI